MNRIFVVFALILAEKRAHGRNASNRSNPTSFKKKKNVLASLSQLSYQADLSKPIIGAGLEGLVTLEPDPGAGPWSRAWSRAWASLR